MREGTGEEHDVVENQSLIFCKFLYLLTGLTLLIQPPWVPISRPYAPLSLTPSHPLSYPPPPLP